jgi:cytochrome P450
MPPVATGAGLPWDIPVDDAVAVLARARAEVGDTFVVDSGGDLYLFTFSPSGVASFYALDEADASKGVADWMMLRRKLPDEIFDGRRTLPHALFGRDDVALYLNNVDAAMTTTVAELGDGGVFDVFALTRRLGHRVGLASWGGPGCAVGESFDRLVRAFDVLDGAEAFVHPDGMAAVATSGKTAERAALAEIVAVVGATVDRADTHGSALFRRIVDAWSGDDPMSTTNNADGRRAGIALDVALVHVASMSNLFAAMGWALVDLLTQAGAREKVIAGDRAYTERCLLESTRLAQRSIMSRRVLAPIGFATELGELQVEPGITIATLLPLTNTTAAPGLDSWDPDRWNRRRLADADRLPAVELVTVFGHGKHTCPAQPFSLAAMNAAVTTLLTTYEMEPRWTARPRPVAAQIGGVARAASACPVAYRRR